MSGFLSAQTLKLRKQKVRHDREDRVATQERDRLIMEADLKRKDHLLAVEVEERRVGIEERKAAVEARKLELSIQQAQLRLMQDLFKIRDK